MKVYVTKYALTKGIKEMEVMRSGAFPDMAIAGPLEFYHGNGKEWHETMESAIKTAEAMRLAKIKSLKASLAKFEKMEFKP